MFYHKLNFKKGPARNATHNVAGGPARIATSKAVAGGFTLIELLVVVAIIGVLAAVIVASLNSGSQKGKNAGVKSNLANARTQAEVFYNTNTAANLSYTNVCNTAGIIGGVSNIYPLVLGAARATGLTTVFVNSSGGSVSGVGRAVCNNTANVWAAQVPLLGGGFWCVDSNNQSKEVATNAIASATDYSCD
jgi:prepilin-type N-terminal cleavage/methylation domain-containing protein